jgi:hypothetical protein
MDYLSRLAGRHGQYGVVFKKDFIETKGGSRVWYLKKGSAPAQALFETIKSRHYPVVEDSDLLLRMTPFIDYVSEVRSFEWEREWRVVGDLRFTSLDVKFLFLPGHEHDDARVFFDSYADIGEGPDLSNAPMIDLDWGDHQIQSVLARV